MPVTEGNILFLLKVGIMLQFLVSQLEPFTLTILGKHLRMLYYCRRSVDPWVHGSAETVQTLTAESFRIKVNSFKKVP